MSEYGRKYSSSKKKSQFPSENGATADMGEGVYVG